jgi:putative transcriptional regulator
MQLAQGLLRTVLVHEQAPRVIRALRGALGMTQAEFARALGWAPSTISRWESGRTRPSRLAFKVILAFGEKHHIRYRPRQPLPVPALCPPAGGERPSFAAPALRDVAPLPARPMPSPRPFSMETGRPRWEAELNFHVALGPKKVRAERSWQRWLRPATVVGASLCVLAAVGVPLITGVPSLSHPEPALMTPIPAPPAVHRERETASVLTDDGPRSATYAARPNGRGPTAAAFPDPEPPPLVAQLEGVTVLGGMHQATFRIATETVTVAEGDQLGKRRAARIRADGVELRDPSGEIRTVRLGGHVPLD